ncbi:MAG TPA: glycosyltransferase [Dehalococcoidia bacterium]|nr:glycosyltransferase [Dehalococcoidia bacterium]
MPKVSVIMLSYNYERYIGEAIESVLVQTFSDFELLIIDDFSRDKSAEIIRRYAQTDARIKCLFHTSNKGIAKSLNEGLFLCKGEYIAYISSDDVWEDDRLQAGVGVLDSTPNVGILYSDLMVIDENSNPTGQLISSLYRSRTGRYSGNLFDTLLRGNFICVSSILMCRRDVEGLRFNEKLRYLNDWLYLLEVSEKNSFYYVSCPLARYRVHPRSTNLDVAAYASDYVTLVAIILEKFLERVRRDRKLLARHYFVIGYLLCSAGELKQGRKYLTRSVKMAPLNIKATSLALISLLGRGTFNIAVKSYRDIRDWRLRGQREK